MSSLDTAPEHAAAGGHSAAPAVRVLGLRPSPDAALGLALACGLTLLAFVTSGGVDLGPNTWAEIALVAIGCALAVAALLYARPGSRWGALTLFLFAGLVTLVAVSISWSVRPDSSWLEANRTLAYLAAFGGATALVRLASERWRGLVGALVVLATALSAYALLVKVFPGTFDPQDPIGRLRAPFDYWNATGLMAALGLAPAVWAGAQRERSSILRALAAPAIAILVTVVILSFSRSALLAAIFALTLWFALVPLRLRGALVLALGCAGGAVLTLSALHARALTHDRIALTARSDAGHRFGLLLVVVLLLLVAAGLATVVAMDRHSLRPRTRRRAGIALITLVALAPLGGIVALTASSRGLTGQVSHAWSTLTDPRKGVGDNAGRLVQLGNSRPRYWSEGLKVGEQSPVHGVGAGGYGTARTRYTNDPLRVQQAHSYPIETFADLGAIGLALNLALLVAWALASRRPFTRASPGTFDGNERIGLLTLLCVVLAFGLHSTIDWTWSIPGTAVPVLVCAGWLAGRGPLTQRVERLGRRRLWAQPGLGVATAAIAMLALLAGWAIWQPLRAADAETTAVAALSRGDARTALAQARSAAAANPLSPEPLWLLSEILGATGDQHGAHAELIKAITLQPQNPATWRALGDYNLRHGRRQEALVVLARAHELDPAGQLTSELTAPGPAPSAHGPRK